MKWKFLLLIVLPFMLLGCKASQKDPVAEQQKKAEEQAEREARFVKTVAALENRDFVIEADRINFRGGQFAYVSANTNFISLKGGDATIQLAFNSPYAGPNGIGGITVDGKVSDVKMTTDKRGNITYTMSVNGIAVSAQVMINVWKGDNACYATVIPNFNGNRITFNGYLYPRDESTVFKGRTL